MFHSVSAVNSVSHLNMKARLFITITTISIEMDKSIGSSRHNHRLFKYPIKVLKGLRDGVKKMSLLGKQSSIDFFLVSSRNSQIRPSSSISIIICFIAFLDVSSKIYGSEISSKKGGNRPPPHSPYLGLSPKKITPSLLNRQISPSLPSSYSSSQCSLSPSPP